MQLKCRKLTVVVVAASVAPVCRQHTSPPSVTLTSLILTRQTIAQSLPSRERSQHAGIPHKHRANLKLLLRPSPVQMHAGTVGPWRDALGIA